MHLQGLDLNLLIALDALLTEKNVTRASERIHISQPGMSAALQKLRIYFEDQLLERVGRNMELTAKALILAEPVKTILSNIRDLTEAMNRFEPAEAYRVFRFSSTTYCSEVLATALLSKLRKIAPNISVQFEELSNDTGSRILEGQIDFAITISARVAEYLNDINSSMNSEELFSDDFSVVMSRNNPFTKDMISFDELCAMRYVETRFAGDITGLGEQIWRQQRRQPFICGWMPNFHLTLDTISHTDLVSVLPSLLTKMKGDSYNVRTLPVPFEMPRLEERLFWHRRNDSDPAHQWMIQVIKDLIKELDI